MSEQEQWLKRRESPMNFRLRGRIGAMRDRLYSCIPGEKRGPFGPVAAGH
jgi:hypothetical protein